MISIYGGTGFIGSNYYEKYKNKSVIIERNSRTPKSENILYFISTIHNYHVFDDPYKDIDTNLRILIETLEECKKLSKSSGNKITFNFISSWFVYGETNLPAHEESICKPKGFYSITKKCAEDLIESYCKTFNMNYRIMRLCNVYGVGDSKSSKKKNALQYMIDNLKKNESINLYEGGNVFRDYMHVKDVCDAINLIVEKGKLNEIYNISSGKKYYLKDVISSCAKILKSSSEINSIPTPDFHKIVQVKNMYLDNKKLLSLGFKQKITIEEGIKELCKI
jgi:nucleoside-diphosphate-sugar epimerase